MANTNGASLVQPPSYEIFSASTNKTHYNLVAAPRIGKIILEAARYDQPRLNTNCLPAIRVQPGRCQIALLLYS